MWARPFGDGGGGAVPLRVGATSSSYGWALGAADLLVPGAARFDMRAVSAVTAFIVPPDVVQDLLASPGTSEVLIPRTPHLTPYTPHPTFYTLHPKP
jgi:hypothetical protein